MRGVGFKGGNAVWDEKAGMRCGIKRRDCGVGLKGGNEVWDEGGNEVWD